MRRSAITLAAVCSAVLVAAVISMAADPPMTGDSAQGRYAYDEFESDAVCADCHVDITHQFHQSLMSECYTHHWDEIEYFELALPHARQIEKVAGIEAGCMSCHSPLAYLADDIPPARPAENTRANEAIPCDICHTMTGFEGDVPFNANWVVAPGGPKQGVRSGTESPVYEIEVNEFLSSAEMCGTCHNEKDPFGVWVKATHLEWKDSPWAAGGIVCQDCHVPPAAGNSAPDAGGQDHPDVRQHLFHGAHDEGKLRGAAEVRIHPSVLDAEPGDTVVLTATVVNAKAGHMIPSGSAEERVVWLHVEATDGTGRTIHLPVDRKGFEGEDMTIADPDARAYFVIGEIQGVEDFAGLSRDGEVPAGDRIYRLPYLDPEGRMTVAQWYTASFGPDYRLEPLKARKETFTWKLPDDMKAGEVTVKATVWYSRLVSSVGEHMGVPPEEWEPVQMGGHTTSFEVVRPG